MDIEMDIEMEIEMEMPRHQDKTNATQRNAWHKYIQR